MLSRTKRLDAPLRKKILFDLRDIYREKPNSLQKRFICEILKGFDVYDFVNQENEHWQLLQSYLCEEQFPDFECFFELWKVASGRKDTIITAEIISCVNKVCLLFANFGRDFSDEQRTGFGKGFIEDWVLPVITQLLSRPSLPESITPIYKHVIIVMKETLKRCCFEPVVELLVPKIEKLKELNRQFSNAERNNDFALKSEQGLGLNGIFGAVIKSAVQAKKMIGFRNMSGASRDENLRERDGGRALSLKWLEHRGWIQLKTDLPREVVQIESYDFQLIDAKILNVFVRDSKGQNFSQTIELFEVVKNVRVAPVSARVLKFRINKFNRDKWGKVSWLKGSFLSRDIDGAWSDFENTDDEEEDLNDQVPPDDEEEFDEIDGDVSELDYVD